jgi:hypothetical protein
MVALVSGVNGHHLERAQLAEHKDMNGDLLLCGVGLLALSLACKSKAEPGEAIADPPGAGTGEAPSVEPAPKPKAAFVAQAGEVIADYAANEVRADAKYKDKRMVVVGVVDEIKKDVLDSIYVIVATPECFGNHRLEHLDKCMVQVQAFFEDDQVAAAAKLNKGDSAAFECTGNGLMMNVLLKDCRLAKIATPVVPASSPAGAKPKKP